MSLETQALVVFDLFIAALLSMLIGIDRERGNHPAGVRTHMLVGVGSCLFTLLSLYAFPGDDQARIASNIVVGIGFLGAGTIVKKEEETNVKNLTTAASIWSTAAVGMAVGVGAWLLAFAAVVVIWFILAIMRRMEIRKDKRDKPNAEQEKSAATSNSR
jgi:putative Mg2+ transporter-C (MgtC) family protein